MFRTTVTEEENVGPAGFPQSVAYFPAGRVHAEGRLISSATVNIPSVLPPATPACSPGR